MARKRALIHHFGDLVARTLLVAGVGTYASMTIVGGCVPGDCGNEYSTTASINEALDSPQLEALNEFARANPTASAEEKLLFLYGEAEKPGPYYSDGLSNVALDLLVEASVASGGIDPYLCQSFCGTSIRECTIEGVGTDSPEVACHSFQECIGGRAPAGLCSDGVVKEGSLEGRYWAYLSHLETAAVFAFKDLYAELQGHCAPPAILRRVAKAVVDEIEHVALTRQMALRHGVTPAPAEITPTAPRTLEEIAIDNAREGCVREAFGALDMLYMSQTTQEPELREIFSQIATDEISHAELSWALDDWLTDHISEEARAWADQEKRAALTKLKADVAVRDTRGSIYEQMADAKAAAHLLQGLGETLEIST